MAHIVTCVYCKQRFDRDKFPFIQVSARRYAHQECSLTEDQKKSKEEQDKEDLEQYIMQLFKEYNYTYSGMRKALIYFYEVKGNSIEKANGGIGIVPYVYQHAYNYYLALWQAQQKNQDKVLTNYIPRIKEVVIPRPQRKVKKRELFTFLDEEKESE